MLTDVLKFKEAEKNSYPLQWFLGFPGGAAGKESA